MMDTFHFLRPGWLLLIPPSCLLAWAAWRSLRGGASWRTVIDANLLPFLLESRPGTTWQRSLIVLLTGWLIALLALAGPAWEKLPSPLERKLDLQIVLFDLSLSMYAQDLKPSRLQRARHKLQDFLTQRAEGQTALVAYAGDAFVVTPFTDDRATILNQVRALDPRLMPAPGSNLPAALRESERLLLDEGIPHTRLLIITDEIRPGQLQPAQRWSEKMDIPLDILAVGTRSGAPIPLPDGDFARDGMGKLVTPGVNLRQLRSLAEETGGHFQRVRPDGSDIAALLAAQQHWNPETAAADGRHADTYRDAGPWLALLLLPLAALAFRRGMLLMLPVFLFVTDVPQAQALDWQPLWQSPDQRALQSFAAKEYGAASDQFEDPAWRASALYRAGRYREAAEQWQALDHASAHYNRGNALARAGELEGALEAYDRALAQNPELEDARANRELVRKLLEEQGQQEPSPGGRQDSPPDAGQQQERNPSAGSEPAEGDQNQAVPSPDQPSAQEAAQQQGDEQPGAPPEKAELQPAEREPRASDPLNDDASEPTESAQTHAQRGEHDQALEQWLRRIPDDPSALLRRKFLWQHQQRGGPADDRQSGEVYW